mmetsp:Transcript_50361/g.126853  ORF Transcript_50361/g.126853 Transcript_50361/m.126853 type:complete len:204 (-) Transcript_50361:1765-2376(-)
MSGQRQLLVLEGLPNLISGCPQPVHLRTQLLCLHPSAPQVCRPHEAELPKLVPQRGGLFHGLLFCPLRFQDETFASSQLRAQTRGGRGVALATEDATELKLERGAPRRPLRGRPLALAADLCGLAPQAVEVRLARGCSAVQDRHLGCDLTLIGRSARGERKCAVQCVDELQVLEAGFALLGTRLAQLPRLAGLGLPELCELSD